MLNGKPPSSHVEGAVGSHRNRVRNRLAWNGMGVVWDGPKVPGGAISGIVGKRRARRSCRPRRHEQQVVRRGVRDRKAAVVGDERVRVAVDGGLEAESYGRAGPVVGIVRRLERAEGRLDPRAIRRREREAHEVAEEFAAAPIGLFAGRGIEVGVLEQHLRSGRRRGPRRDRSPLRRALPPRHRGQVAEQRRDLATRGDAIDRARAVEARRLVPSVQLDGAAPSPDSATIRLPSGATVSFLGWFNPVASGWTTASSCFSCVQVDVSIASVVTGML